MLKTTPKSVYVAPRKSAKSISEDDALDTYIGFLAMYSYAQDSRSTRRKLPASIEGKMGAIFDASDLASPLAYGAPQTALVLMDFQNFIIARAPEIGKVAVTRAQMMREWALKQKMMVLHSIVNIHAQPPPTCKGFERITKMLEEAVKDPSAGEEPAEIAFNRQEHEYIAFKSPGHNSALKSQGAMDILREHDIRSLILCGLSTSGCVLRTSIGATDEGFVVSAIEDACADPVPGLHDTLIKRVLPSRAHVATAEEFVRRWDGEGSNQQ